MKKRSEEHKRRIAEAQRARHNFPPFEEARKEVRALHFKDVADYLKNRPSHLPYNADVHYKNRGWISWFDYLGKKAWARSCKDFPPFEEARKEVGLCISKPERTTKIIIQRICPTIPNTPIQNAATGSPGMTFWAPKTVPVCYLSKKQER